MDYGFFIMNLSEGLVFSPIRKSIPFSPRIKSTLGELPEPGSIGRAPTAIAFSNIVDML
tara:strand:+ start:779 stop:955 length:177 start_codon:yes stop_codon:yes gene_type:complete